MAVPDSSPFKYNPQNIKKGVITPQLTKKLLNRNDMYKGLGLGADTEVAKTSPIPANTFNPWGRVARPDVPEREENAIFNIPILGRGLDLLDTPGAMIRSAVKEIGDIFAEDESFSIGEWWKQAGDNIFMGEVLRDWGVDLPGPLDFALGLTLDIAFDPLTYMLPLGAWARVATKPQMLKHLTDVATAARYGKVKDIAKAERMEAAAERVGKRGIFAAGKDVLEELGLPTAMRFSMPLTGRLGRGIFERPLRNIPGVGPKFAAWANKKRVGQLKPVNTEVLEVAKPLKALSEEAIQTRVLKAVQQLDAAKGAGKTKQVIDRTVKRAPKTGRQVITSAQRAMRMPIELSFEIPYGYVALAAVAGLPGRAMGEAQKFKMMNTLSKGLSTRFALNQMYRSGNALDIQNALMLEGAGARANILAGTFGRKHTLALDAVVAEARTLDADLTFDDIFRAGNEQMGTVTAGELNPLYGPFATGGDLEVQAVVKKLQTWFKDVLEDYNVSLPWSEDLPALLSEMYVTRQIGRKQRKLVAKNPKSVRLDEFGPELTGSPFVNRELSLPDEIIAHWENGNISQEQIDMVEDLYKVSFDEALNSGLPVQVTTEDGRILRSSFMGQGFKPYAAEGGGSVLTQMDNIGKSRMGTEYQALFTDDAAIALPRYLGMMTSTVRAKSIVDDLAQAGIIVKGNDKGYINNFVGNKIAKGIDDAKKTRTKAEKKKIRLEKRIAIEAEVVSKYADDPVDELVAAQPRNRKGIGPNRRETAAAGDQLVEWRQGIEDIDSAATALRDGTADHLTEGGRRILQEGLPEQPRVGGKFGPKAKPLGPSAREAKAQAAYDAITEADVASAMEELVRIREAIDIASQQRKAIVAEIEKRLRFSPESADFIAEVEALGEYLVQQEEWIQYLAQNASRNMQELSASVQGAEILERLGKGDFGDVTFFKAHVSHAQETAVDVATQRVRDAEEVLTQRKLVDVDIGGGSETKAIWKAYTEANPGWNRNTTMSAAVSGNKITLRNVGELQLERIQRFANDWIAQRGGTAVSDGIPLQKAGKEASTWSEARNMGAENWPARGVDEINELIAEELGAGSVVKFSTGPQKGVGATGGRIRSTDGSLTEHSGEFVIRKKSDAEWVVDVDGTEIPITGPRASETAGRNAGEQGLVVWLPRQQRSIYFNPTPRSGVYAQNVPKAANKQQLGAARAFGRRIDNALDERMEGVLQAQEQVGKAKARLIDANKALQKEYTLNVVESFNLLQYSSTAAREAAPAQEVIERVAIRMPPPGRQTIPQPRVGPHVSSVSSRDPNVPMWGTSEGGVHRLGGNRIEVDGPNGRRIVLEGDEARDYLRARRPASTGPRALPEVTPQPTPTPRSPEVYERDVFAVNTKSDDLWIYADEGATPTEWTGRVNPEDGGPRPGLSSGSVDRELILVRPTGELHTATSGEVFRVYEPVQLDPTIPLRRRAGGSRRASAWDLQDSVASGGKVEFDDAGEALVTGQNFQKGRSANRQFRAREQRNHWALLDEDGVIEALESGTYVGPAPNMSRRTSGAEQAKVEQIFGSEPYRGWIEKVQEVQKLQAELFEAEKFLIGSLNQPLAVIQNRMLRYNEAAKKLFEAKITTLNDQIAAGVKGKHGAVRNREAVRQLEFSKQALEEQVVAANEELARIRQWLQDNVPEHTNAQGNIKRITEGEMAVVLQSIEQQSKVINDFVRQIEKAITDVKAGTVTKIDYAQSQKEALKVLNNARAQHTLGAVHEQNVGEYLIQSGGFGKSGEISSRTKRHLSGYQLVNAGDESAELFEAAFESIARLRNPVQTKAWMHNYSKFVNYWKAQAVATTGFVYRNLMGGTWINNQMAGVPVSLHMRVDLMRKKALKAAEDAGRPRDVAYGARLIAKEGKRVPIGHGLGRAEPHEWNVMADWAETGMANTGLTSMEVRNAVNEAGSSLVEHAKTAKAWKPWSSENILFTSIGRLNQRAEFTLRGALAHHIMMGGGSPGEALAAVYKYHFDYTNLTHMDQKMKMVIPFWTWQKNIIPVLIESLGKKPQAWNRIVQVKGELELTSEREGIVPDYFGENMGIRLPFQTDGNRVYALPDLPFKDLARYLKTPSSPARGLIESALPFYKLPIELWAGKRTFADIPFTGRYQQVPHAMEKLPGFMPLMAAFGKAEKNKRGEWKMRDQTIYVIEQSMPLLGRLRRLIPNEDAKQKRLMTTYFSTLFGMGLRTNTPQEKRNQLIKDKIKHSEDRRDLLDIETRKV